MNNDEKNAADWGNYWQGRAASKAGAALVGVGIENNAEIATHWRRFFAALDKDQALLDVACGAGSVIGPALDSGIKSVTGLDLSQDAITALKSAYPPVKAQQGSARDMPFADAQFECVTSQFGFEYAGAHEAGVEMARVLKSGGLFHAIIHKADGAIFQEVSIKAQTATAILQTGFIESANRIFEVDMSGGTDADFQAAAQDFGAKQDALIDLAKRHSGLSAHLYQGTQTLFQNRKSYALDDITAWLDDMQNEIKAFQGRMESMLSAALTQDGIAALMQVLATEEVMCDPVAVLQLGAKQDSAGWILHGVKT